MVPSGSSVRDQPPITARSIPHVGSTCGYRVDWNGRSVAYMSDHQQPLDGTFSADARIEIAIAPSDVPGAEISKIVFDDGACACPPTGATCSR